MDRAIEPVKAGAEDLLYADISNRRPQVDDDYARIQCRGEFSGTRGGNCTGYEGFPQWGSPEPGLPRLLAESGQPQYGPAI